MDLERKVGEKYLYCINIIKEELIKYKIIYSIIAIVLLSVTTAVGYVDTYTTKYFFITVPYTVLFLPELIFLISCFEFATIVDLFRFKTYKKIFIWVKKISITNIFLSGMCACCEIIVLVFDSKITSVKNEIIFLIGIIVVLGLSIVLYFLQRKISSKVVSFEKKEQASQEENYE